MMKFFPTLAAAGFVLAGFAFDAQAMPAASVVGTHAPGITLVRQDCGLGFHRGPMGHCRRNRPLRHCVTHPSPRGPVTVCRP